MKDYKLLGSPESRIEGYLKVTGKAKYSAEFPIPNALYGFPVRSTISKGSIATIDTEKAEASEGVVKIITYKNALDLGEDKKNDSGKISEGTRKVLQDNVIKSYGQYIGIVVAETFEQARAASRMIEVTYNEEKPVISFEENRNKAYKPDPGRPSGIDTSRGSLEQGINEATTMVDEVYNTPIEVHNPMEPHATIAVFEGEKLTIYDTSQMLYRTIDAVAEVFSMPKEDIKVIATFIGGGFGSKLRAWEHVMLTILAAKMLDKPVKTAITRQMMQTNAGMRQHNRQHIRLGANDSARLTALAHEVVSHTAVDELYVEKSGYYSRSMYAVPNTLVTHRVYDTNIQVPSSMRAPGEAPGSFALESAMDEMAHKLNMDPIEFRIKNEPEKDPHTDKPWSSRSLIECMKVGAEKFGWERRKQEPRSNPDGNWLIGYGMAGASRGAPYQQASSRLILNKKGDEVTATVEMAATDIGTGSYTIIAQTAANTLGIPVDQVEVHIGDSSLPKTPGSGGSWGAGTFSSAADAVCEKVIKDLKEKAGIATDQEISIGDLLDAAKLDTYKAVATAMADDDASNYSHYSFGAHFVEVWVDEKLGIVKIPHVLSTAAVGTVLNQKTARSQVLGGIIFGLGQAMTEETLLDERYGSYVTRTLADYHVPVNLDIGKIDLHFIPEKDEHINRMGVKGIGELGISSVAAAITNAIFNATGKRARNLPVTPAKMIAIDESVAV
ncbi:xanthine dehydrogenase family protein molybdopterin-binding subunit [Flavimarina sp. Hel_I_48]|uniref:xanthine dehydrogenase family protein molybdopterin-binding subunit n=1 Tax=Flavimarina sp. Hel_I_48 TaxID=1392488 RepID=UPI0004DF3C0B|nr:xanthine dehydrogenase family protein molybdopterin-binding subunit [Flavimarina sp. Hel_I_48]